MFIVFLWQQWLRERASMLRLRTLPVLKKNVSTPKSSGHPTSSRFYSIWSHSNEYQIMAAQDLPPCSLVDGTYSTHRQGRRSDYKRPGRPEVPFAHDGYKHLQSEGYQLDSDILAKVPTYNITLRAQCFIPQVQARSLTSSQLAWDYVIMTSVNPFKTRGILQGVPFIVSTRKQLYRTERLHLLSYSVTSIVHRKTTKETPCTCATCFQVKNLYFVLTEYFRSVLFSLRTAVISLNYQTVYYFNTCTVHLLLFCYHNQHVHN